MKKKKFSKKQNDKQQFQGHKRKKFERDIRPLKKRRLEGSTDKVLTKKQMKKNFFSKRQYVQKEFEAKKITEESILRKINENEDEEEGKGHPYKELLDMFGMKNEAENEASLHNEEESINEEDDIEDSDNIEECDNQNGIAISNDQSETNDNNDQIEDDHEESDSSNVKDPYKEHFGRELDVATATSLLQPGKWNIEKVQINNLGETTIAYPPSMPSPLLQFEHIDINKSCVRNHILSQFKTISQKYPSFAPKSGYLSQLQEDLFPIVNSYTDLYFPSRTPNNGEDLMLLYCLHALSHVTKIRNIVIKNNMKIKERIEKRLKKKNKMDEDVDGNIQDQGYARPKVLILVPFRNCVLKIVNVLIYLLASEKAMVSQKLRFMEEFGMPEEEVKKGLKPDIIIASPLGLKEVVEPMEEKGKKKIGDHMFLSSIEILIIDQADVMLMQNWNNVVTILNHLNKQPDGKFTADIARIKDYYINGWQRLYRQTLVFSSFQTPEINGAFQKFASNYKGRCITPIQLSKPTMCNILSSLPQTFKRFTVKSIEDMSELRFQFFIKRVLPTIKNNSDDHVIIFIPSYYDFVRIRKYMKKEEIEFEEICEYTKKERVSRARQFFFEGRMKYLLYTERFHYYYRYFIRGIHHLIFYDLPTNAQFYPELCNMIMDYKKEIVPVNTSCTVLYNKYDVQKLMRIAGSERTNEMINSDEDTFNYVSVDS